MVTGSFRYGPGGKKEYRIGGRLVEASSLAEALEVARRNMQYEMEDMPEGALSYRTPDMNRMRESDQAEEAETLRQQAAMASGRTPAQYDSGRPRVSEGMEAWMYDPRIKKPGEFPNTYGMDVADLARRSGVSESVARKVVNDTLPRLSGIAGINEPDDYDNPDIYPQNLPSGFPRKSYAQWNLGSGDIWSNPSAMNMFRYKSEGWVDRSDPTGARNKRPEEMTPGITEDEKKVYRTLHTGSPEQTGPYWSGSESVEPPYPDSPHVELSSGKWGPAPTGRNYAIGGKTYRADNFEAALRKFNADPARLDNRGNPTTITLPTAMTEQAASSVLDRPAATPMPGIDRGTGDQRRWMGGGPGRTATEFIPRGDADRGMQFVDEYSGDYFPTTGPRRAVGGGAMTGWGDNEDLGWGDYATPGTMGIGPAGDASLDPTTQTIYSPTPVGRMRHFMPPDRGMEFVDEYSGVYSPTADPRRMMGGGPGRVMQPRQFIGSGDMTGWGDNEDLGWYGGATYAQQNPGVLASPMGFGPRGDPPGEAAYPITLDMMDWGPEEMGYGVGPQGPGGMLGWGDEEMGYGMGQRIPAGLPTAGNIGTLGPEGGYGDVGPQQNLVAPLSEQNFSPYGRYGEEGQNQPPPIPTMVKPGQMPETIGGRRNLEEFFGVDNIDLVRRLAFNQFLGDRFPQGSTGIGQDFYRGLRSPLESDFSLSTLLGKATGSIEDYYANLGDLPQLSEWNPRLRDAASIIGASPEQGGLTEAQRSVYTPLRTGEGQIDQFNMAITPQMRALPASLRNDFYQAALQKFYDVLARESLPTPSASEWGEGGQEPAAAPRSFAEAGSFQFLPWYVDQGFDMWGGGRNYDPYGME